MNCDRDGSIMQIAGSALTADKKELLTTWLCPRCFSRKTERVYNSRYEPIVTEPERGYNKPIGNRRKYEH